MTGGDWHRAWEVFEDLADGPVGERRRAAEAACGDDARLLKAVLGLLEADRQDDHLLDRPVVPAGTFGDAAAGPTTEVAGGPSGSTGRGLTRGMAVGQYRVLRLLAEGGMGAVYLAARDDDSFDRRVVIKLVRAGMESEQILDRLKQERRILAALDHPYISRLYDGGSTDDGSPYFVLEYIDGQPIDKYCRDNALSVDERLELFGKVCEAVQFAHRNLVIHRDLKPGNILVTEQGDPKLLDFGIAKLVNPNMAGDVGEPTDVLMRIATPNYASPEQLRGAPVSTASDVYSLGVLLYLLLADHLPYSFAGLSLAEIDRRLASSSPLPPSAALAAGSDAGEANTRSETPALRVDRDLDAIVLKALRTVPRQRYDSPQHLADDIDRYRRGLPVEAHAGDWRYRVGKLYRRHRAAFAAAAMVTLFLVGAAVTFAVQARRVAAERDAVIVERDKKNEVLSLMLELFSLANPYVEPGEELTVREAVDRSVGLLAGSLADQPDVHAELLLHAGRLMADLGQSEASRDLLAQSLAVRRGVAVSEAEVDLEAELAGASLGAEGTDGGRAPLAETVSALAGSYKQLGELEQAETLARRAVDLARRSAERTADRQVAASLLAGPINELVSVLCYRSEYTAAEDPAREALELARSLPTAGPRGIVALEHMARIRSAGGDYAASARYLREAVALRRERYGERHPGQLGTLNNLGASLRRDGELEAAERVYGEALEIYRHNFGERESARVLPALLNNLATVAYQRGRYGRALELFGEADRVVIAAEGPDHWMSFHFQVRQAKTRIAAGESAAIEPLRRLIAKWTPAFGVDHWRLAEARGVVGDGLSRAGRCEEAETILVESFDRLLEASNQNVRDEGFSRLREHFTRCGEGGEIEPYAERFAAAGR